MIGFLLLALCLAVGVYVIKLFLDWLEVGQPLRQIVLLLLAVLVIYLLVQRLGVL